MNHLSLLTKGSNRACKNKEIITVFPGLSGLWWLRLPSLAWLLLSTVVTVWGGDSERRYFNIPPSPASQALSLFARQADIQLLYPYDLASDIQMPGVAGQYSVEEALEVLIAGTCLEAEFSRESIQLNVDNKGWGFWFMKKESCTKKNKLSAIMAAVLAGSAAANVHSQEGAAMTTTLEEVVVTARKRSESIQDVPVAVSAITGSDIESAFTLDTTSLAQFAPNVVLTTIEAGSPANGGFAIRGISYQDVEKAFDPTVVVAVDGVPLSTAVGQVFDLIDVERIEILRGPQGTLFGKNVVGGLINIHRVKPKLDEISGSLRGRVGEYDKSQGDFLFNYGEEHWAMKLTGGIARQGKGYTKNRIGSDPDKRDSSHAGAHFLWAPNEIFTGELQLNYSKLEGNSAAQINTSKDENDIFCGAFGTCSGSFGRPVTGDRRRIETDYIGRVGLETVRASTELNVQITEDHTLTYIGGWLTANDLFSADSDSTALPIFAFERWGEFSQTSHELRISGEGDSPLSWQAGLFSTTSDGDTYQLSNTFLLTGVNAWTPFEDTETRSESHSIFAEGDYRMLEDKLVWTLGTRYITETKEMSRSVSDTLTGDFSIGPNAGGKRTDNDWIYRWGVRYHFSDDLMVYFTNSTGFRSGGFSPRANTQEVLGKGYAPETLTNYEAGLRSTLLGGRMNLNVTAFHMVYEDMQVEASIPAPNLATQQQLAILNVGEAELSGLELEVDYLAHDYWKLSANLGLLDADFKKFTADLYGDGIIADETGLDMRRAPKWTASLHSTIDIPVGQGNISWRISYTWQDDYETTLNNHPGTEVDAHGMLDSSLSYDIASWRLSLFGRNLTDEDHYSHALSINSGRPQAGGGNPGSFWTYGVPVAPREIGVEALYRF